MLSVSDMVPEFSVIGIKPDFMHPEEKGSSAFETLTHESFPGLWKIFYFYPKDFSSVCASEAVAFAKLHKAFADRDCVLLGGSSDNEFCKLAWRRANEEMKNYPAWQFSDLNGSLIDGLGVRSLAGPALRATFIVDKQNVIQSASVNSLFVGRNPQEILRVLDALQTDAPCMSERPVGGGTP